MSSSSTDPPELDLRIKGSLPSGSSSLGPTPTFHPPPLEPTDPLDSAPSSPSQVYLNLLILEASLRSQWIHHQTRRRKFTFFLIVLCLWTLFWGYRFFVLGGSPYYFISHFEKLGLGGGIVTGALYYGTGLYHTTIRDPRRFVGVANRGLRGFNVKLVKTPLPLRQRIYWWWQWYTFKPPPQPVPTSTAVRRRPSSNNRRPSPPIPTHVHAPSLSSMALKPPQSQRNHDEEDDEDDVVEEYLPGGLHVKLVVTAKGFSPDFREGWELYRTEYWDKENEARENRRRELKVRRHMKPEDPMLAAPPSTDRRMRSTRAGSSSSNRGRTPTPDPDRTLHPGRARRGSTASLRRSITPLPADDVSDSGSTTSARGERDRARRSDSVRSDKSSSSTGSVEKAGKSGGKGRGKKRSAKSREP